MSNLNDFDYEIPDVRCDHQGEYINGEYTGCANPGVYHVWWNHPGKLDGYDDAVYFCEFHWAEAYRSEFGSYPSGYVDKDARIAELERQLTEAQHDAEVGKTLQKWFPSKCLLHNTVGGIGVELGIKLNGKWVWYKGATLRIALAAAGLLKEEAK